MRADTADVLAVNPNVQPAVFADEYHVGETAIAIGNPENEGISVTEGIVSVDSEGDLPADRQHRAHLPLPAHRYRHLRRKLGRRTVQRRGELIGITNAGDQEDENINFAIPLEIAKGTADNVLYFYRDGNEETTGAYTPSIGITTVAQNTRYSYDAGVGYGKITEEIVVDQVSSGSIAAQVGLQQNDRVTAFVINGVKKQLDRCYDFTDTLLTLRPGDTISFEITRGSETATTSSYQLVWGDFRTLS